MNTRHLMLLFTPVLAMVAACGVVAKAGKVRGSQRSADLAEKAAVGLDISSTLKDGVFTNLGKHQLTVTLNGNATLNSAAPGFIASLKTKVKLTGPSGAELPIVNDAGAVVDGGVQSSATSKWTILLDEKGGSAEGKYKISIEVIAPGSVDKNIIDLPKSWEANVTLDTTPPVVGLRASLTSSLETGARTLNVHAFIAGESKGACSTSELRTSVSGTTLPLTLAAIQDEDYAKGASIPAGSALFSVKDLALPDNLKDPFTVYAKCSDQAGNASEFILPVIATTTPFLFTAVAEGNIGNLPTGSGTAAYVNPGILKVDMTLVDAKTGARAADLFTSREQSLLRATVTDTAVSSLAALQAIKSPIWSQVYTPVMSVPMSSGYDGQKTLYVSLVLHDLATSTDQLLGTVPLSIFVVTSQAKVAWTGKPQFVPFAPNAAITGQFIITLGQAPLANKDPILLDYSVDGTTWVALPATYTKLTTTGTPYQFSATYPLTTESPFRLRARITDLAGNLTTSATSGNIIGRSALTGLTIAQSERDGKVGFSDFKPWLGSAVMCRKVDGLGAQSGSYNVQLLVQNRGAVAMTYYSSGTVNPGMGYQVMFTNPASNFYGRFEPPTDLTLGTTDIGLFDFAITDTWLTSPKITIRFGLEATASTSLTNQYVPGGINYQDVVIQDTAIGLTLVKGPFGCDNNQLLAP